MDTKLKYIFTLLLLVALECTGQEYNWKNSVFANPNDGNSLYGEQIVDESGNRFFLSYFNEILSINNTEITTSQKGLFISKINKNDSLIWVSKILNSNFDTGNPFYYNTTSFPKLNKIQNNLYITFSILDTLTIFDSIYEASITSSKAILIEMESHAGLLKGISEIGSGNCNFGFSKNNSVEKHDLNVILSLNQSFQNGVDSCYCIINNDTTYIKELTYLRLKIKSPSQKIEKIKNCYFEGFVNDNLNGYYFYGETNGVPLINDTSLSINSNLDHTYFISKIDSNGAVKWTRYFGINGWDSHIQLHDLHISSPNDIIITGRSFAQSVPNTVRFQNAPTLFGGSSTDDYFVVCYDSLGNVKWQNKSKGFSRERLTSLTSDKDKNVYGLVTFLSSVEFASDTFYSKGSEDILLVCFDSLGNEKWAKQAGGTGLDQGFKIGIDSNENLYVLGGTKSSPVHFGTISYQLSGNNAQFFLAKLDTSSIPNIGIVPQEEPGFFTLYPNPNYGEFLVETKEGLISHIEISNLKGQVIYKDQPQSNKTEISLNYLPKGLFFVKITKSNGKVIVNKFVKK